MCPKLSWRFTVRPFLNSKKLRVFCDFFMLEATLFFFLPLPFDHHGPVSKLFLFTNRIQSCTGPFNWGEAHCAGEKVKLQNRTNADRSLVAKEQKQQQTGRSPPRQPGTPRPGSQYARSNPLRQSELRASKTDFCDFCTTAFALTTCFAADVFAQPLGETSLLARSLACLMVSGIIQIGINICAHFHSSKVN